MTTTQMIIVLVTSIINLWTAWLNSRNTKKNGRRAGRRPRKKK